MLDEREAPVAPEERHLAFNNKPLLARAAVVAAVRRGLTDRRVTVHVPGGQLLIDWREDGAWMEGPTAIVFHATLTPAWLA